MKRLDATSKRFLMNIKTINDIRHKNLGKIVIGHLNINATRQKIANRNYYWKH